MSDATGKTPAIEVRGLEFAYPLGHTESGPPRPPVLKGIDLALPAGARCLLIGANGAGKSTLLHVLGGRFLIPPDRVRVLGRPAFHDTTLTAERVFLGGNFPLDIDITVGEILDGKTGIDGARLARLMAVLGVERDWHMHRVSDGQRRRVQILLGLMKPPRVLLLDEVTTDLDVIARADLLSLLKDETEAGAAVLYATHIFDGLDRWATHLVHLAGGKIRWMGTLDDCADLQAARAAGAPSPLLRTVETWLRTYGA